MSSKALHASQLDFSISVSHYHWRHLHKLLTKASPRGSASPNELTGFCRSKHPSQHLLNIRENSSFLLTASLFCLVFHRTKSHIYSQPQVTEPQTNLHPPNEGTPIHHSKFCNFLRHMQGPWYPGYDQHALPQTFLFSLLTVSVPLLSKN